MYTLRTIAQDNTEHNLFLGFSYSVVRLENSTEAFSKEWENVFQAEYKADEKNGENFCYAFVISENNKESIPLYVNNRNYIVADSGKTFCNISF